MGKDMLTKQDRRRPVAISMATGVMIIAKLIEVVCAGAPPRIIESNYQMRHLVREGETVLRLTCPVESATPPLIDWVKDGVTIHPGWDRYRISGEYGDRLTIKDLEISDSGVVVCSATNGFGTVNAKYLVYVYAERNDTVIPPEDFDESIFDIFPGNHESPAFLDIDKMISVVSPYAGSTIHLSCKMAGRPVPEISWLKDGKRLSSATLDTDDDGDVRGVSILRLSHVRGADSGRYTCVGTNRAGTVNFTYTVNVIEDTSVPKPQFFLQPLKNITIAYRNTAAFQCLVHGETTPRIQWLRRVESTTDVRNTSGTITVHNQPYVVLSSSQTVPRSDGSYLNKLFIHNATEQDAGMYICSAATVDGLGLVFSSAYLNVITGKRPALHDQTYEDSIAPPTESSILPIILIILIIVGVAFIAIVAIVVCRRRSNNREKSRGGGNLKTTAGPPLPPPRPIPSTSNSTVTGSSSAPRSNSITDKHQYAALEPTPNTAYPISATAHERLFVTSPVVHERVVIGSSRLAGNVSSEHDASLSDPVHLHEAAFTPQQYLLQQQYHQQQTQRQYQLQQKEYYQQQQQLQQQEQQACLQPKHHNSNFSRYEDIAYC